MSLSREIARLVARVRALTLDDWRGKAGDVFRNTVRAISEFAEGHRVTPRNVLDEGIELSRRKLEGLANHEFSEAAKNFADVEKAKIDVELQLRSLDSDIKRRKADARKADADARTAELNVLAAEIDLLRKLKETGVILRRDANGNLTVLPTPHGVDLSQLAEQRKLSVGEPLDNPIPASIGEVERLLATAREAGDRNGEADALNALGNEYEILGDKRSAIKYYGQGLAVAREIGDHLGQCKALGLLSRAYSTLGDHRDALAHYVMELEILRKIGDRDGESHALWDMAHELDFIGNRNAAIEHAEAALKIFEDIKGPVVEDVREQLVLWRNS